MLTTTSEPPAPPTDEPVPSPMAPAQAGAAVVPLSPGLVLIAFPAGLTGDPDAKLIVRPVEGTLAPPLSWYRLGTRGGDLRFLLLARTQPRLAAGAALQVTPPDGAMVAFRLERGGALHDLLPADDAAATLTLVRFLASKATGLLRAAEDSALAALLVDLLRTHSAPERGAVPLALAGPELVLWALPAPIPPASGTTYLLNRRRLRRLTLSGEHALLPDRRLGDAYLLPAGEGALPIPLPAMRRRPPTLGVLGRRKDARARAIHRLGVAALGERAATDPTARGLLRDLQLLGPTEKPHHYAQASRPFGAGLDMAIDDHAGGVFLRGWLRDPLGLVAGISLRGPNGDRALPLGQLHRFHRAELAAKYAASPHGGLGIRAGFCAHLSDAAAIPAAQWSLRLELTTGDPMVLVAPAGILHPQNARDAVLGAIAPPEASPTLLAGAIVPAVERLHRVVMAARQPPESVVFGVLPRRPDVALVVPLYRNLRFLRHQFAAFARDRSLKTTELIYVLDSPEQRGEVEHLLRGLHGVYGLPVQLLTQPGNYGYASACNAGAAVARAPLLLMLNSDVVPAARGWLRPLATAVVRQPSVVAAGPKLLFEDGSLQHAGLTFERGTDGEWFNNHFHKGYPRDFPAAQEARRVPAVTGAALLVRRAAFQAVGGFTTDYVIGDYEDSDLCLKLRAAGGEIAYAPRAELYHFERQSIRDHAGYATTLAAIYNRRLHHQRWSDAIARLMARVERRAARAR